MRDLWRYPDIRQVDWECREYGKAQRHRNAVMLLLVMAAGQEQRRNAGVLVGFAHWKSLLAEVHSHEARNESRECGRDMQVGMARAG